MNEERFVIYTDVVVSAIDPKDNKFLELAISGGATGIISGDVDLLVLHPFRGIPIIAPKSFISRA